MATIHIQQLNQTIETSDESLSLMEVLLKNKIPVASSCGGDGVCGKCTLTVKGLKEDTLKQIEEKFCHKDKWKPNTRLSCQLNLEKSDYVFVESTYW